MNLDFIYFSAIDWSFRRLPHHYICEEILRRGGRVYFVENTGVRWPSWRDLSRVVRRGARLIASSGKGFSLAKPGLTVIPPIALPPSGSRLLRTWNAALVHGQIGRVLGRARLDRTIAFVTVPNWTTHDVVRMTRPIATVYFCADEFAQIPGADRTISESEDALLRIADVVFVTSQRLADLAARAGPRPIVVPSGVDLKAFAPAAERRLPRPAPLAPLTGKVIGYVGGLNHKVDVQLLETVADAFPDAALVILGDVDDTRYVPAPRRNLHLLGGRAHAEVPGYLQHFDVCLVPYLRNEFTDSVYPAKLNEYLAAGCSVVSTALPEVRPFADVVRIAAEPSEFIAHVRAALQEERTEATVRARIAVAARSSYDIVIPPMLAAIDAAREKNLSRRRARTPMDLP